MIQILHITITSLRSIPSRIGESLVVCVGIGCVVIVIVTALSLATSMKAGVGATGRADRVLVLRKDAITESLSSIGREEIAKLQPLVGVARGDGGESDISPEILVSVSIAPSDVSTEGLVLVRGMTSRGFAIRPEVTLSEGRMFDAGKHEVVVGRLLREEFPSLAVDNQLSINGVAWIIVGVFESRGDAHESEILADGSALMAMTGANEYSSATVRLTEPDMFSAFSSAVSAIPGTNLKAQRESEYYEGQSETISSVAFVLAYVVSTIMALGAVSGALNITYSVVDARAVEIATLRALGFGSLPIIVSILAEAMLLGVVGGCVGALLAWISLDGGTFVAAQYLGVGASVNNMALSLTITPQLVATGIGWACVIGLLGALLPAFRVSRRPIAQGLRFG